MKKSFLVLFFKKGLLSFLTAALFGIATALVSQAIGEVAMLGPAIALVSVPCMLASAACFAVAIRGKKELLF